MTDLKSIDKELVGLKAKLRWDHVDHDAIKRRIEELEGKRRDALVEAGQ